MMKETYKFSSRYQDVDFERILEENPLAHFIEVKWAKTEGSFCGLVIVTDSGYERLRKNGLSTPRRYVNARIACDGIGWGHDSFDMGGIRIIENIKAFRNILAKLKDRECRKHEIKVTAIK
jgi:hypothetical protein